MSEIIQIETPAPAPMPPANCGNCSYFYRSQEPGSMAPGLPMSGTDKKTIGECRRNPPVAVLVPAQSIRGEGLAAVSQFMPVTVDSWCGEHPALATMRAAENARAETVARVEALLFELSLPESMAALRRIYNGMV